MSLGRGSVVLVTLDPTVGREQQGVRPCVVVSDLRVTQSQRFPLLCVVPITSTPGTGLLYPALSSGPSGLRKQSFALVDQLRSVDKRRIIRLFGEVSPDEIAAIDDGLILYLGLSFRLRGAVQGLD